MDLQGFLDLVVLANMVDNGGRLDWKCVMARPTINNNSLGLDHRPNYLSTVIITRVRRLMYTNQNRFSIRCGNIWALHTPPV